MLGFPVLHHLSEFAQTHGHLLVSAGGKPLGRFFCFRNKEAYRNQDMGQKRPWGREKGKEEEMDEGGRKSRKHTDEQQMGEARKPYHILFRSWDPGRTPEWTRVPGREGGGGEFCAYLPRILLTQPWLTRSWREMSQGLTPWWARSTMR